MGYTCGALTLKELSCRLRVKIEGGRCWRHNDIEKDEERSKQTRLKNQQKKKKKIKEPVDEEKDDTMIKLKCYDENEDKGRFIEGDDKVCKMCKQRQKWYSMSEICYSNYEISSLGKFHNLKMDNFFNGHFTKDDYGYYVVRLIHDDGSKRRNIVSNWIGRIMLDIKCGDKKFSADHINRNRTDNCLCNLRKASKSEQSKNRNHKTHTRGKQVEKLSVNGNVVLETFDSVTLAALGVGVHRNMISLTCRNKKICEGFRWRFAKYTDKEDEIWLSSKDAFPKLKEFEASSYGNVRINGIVKRGYKYGRYLSIDLQCKNLLEYKKKYIHILICAIFHGPKPEGMEVSHLDNNGLNNKISNLEWATHRNNMRNSGRKVRAIYEDGIRVEFNSITEAVEGTETKVSIAAITHNCRGRQKSAGRDKYGNKIRWEYI